MKIYILYLAGTLILFMTSCRHSDETIPEEEPTLLNEPTNEVTLTVGDKTFTVDFRINDWCMSSMKHTFEPMEQLKTRDDLINLFKSISPHYMLNPGVVTDVNERQSYALQVEYMLARECFSDGCDSEIRRDILPFIVTNQKEKCRQLEYGVYVHSPCAQKCGIFLMAVILLKERNDSAKFIDDDTLQQALLCLNTDMYGVDKEFSDYIIECCERFLTYSYPNPVSDVLNIL